MITIMMVATVAKIRITEVSELCFEVFIDDGGYMIITSLRRVGDFPGSFQVQERFQKMVGCCFYHYYNYYYYHYYYQDMIRIRLVIS